MHTEIGSYEKSEVINEPEKKRECIANICRAVRAVRDNAEH